jgi:DNA-binding transcriptional regulator YdaS (Cro superfamily)
MDKTNALDDPATRIAIASGLGIPKQIVNHWHKRRVPAEKCPAIEALLGIKCEELRPDVNWAVLRAVSVGHA